MLHCPRESPTNRWFLLTVAPEQCRDRGSQVQLWTLSKTSNSLLLTGSLPNNNHRLTYILYIVCLLSHTYIHTYIEVAQSSLTLRDPLDCSPPGPSVHGILQARTAEWVPFPPPGDLPDPGIAPTPLRPSSVGSGAGSHH